MARLNANENFPLQVVIALRQLGHDVLTVQESGLAEKRTKALTVLKFATDDGRAVLTLNRRHFIRLHLEGAVHAGIIACTADPDFAGQAARINAAVGAAGQLGGKLLRVNRPAS